jgi:hypothetical protein
MQTIAGACVDTGRAARCGYGEVVYGEGKSAPLIASIARSLLATQPEALVTRIDPASAEQVAAHFPHHQHCAASRTLRLADHPLVEWRNRERPSVTVVSAGSTDRGVALEACQTLAWMGVRHHFLEDLGVAGPQRLLAVVPELRRSRVIIVAAGMEGALPSVVAGHVDCPVIGLPTSVGYGAALGGMTAMLGMLTSCAAGVAVVNIDGGFKAGYLAGLIAGSDRERGGSAPPPDRASAEP